MPERVLTTFEQVLLGMVCATPSSGYDLKRRFAATPMGVYQPSSGALYPALRRLKRGGLLRTGDGSASHSPAGARAGRRRRVYGATDAGRGAHLRWLRTPVDPDSVARDLGMHLLRFVMMEPLLPRAEVLQFLSDLRDALAHFVAGLDRYTAGADFPDRHSRLALEHGITVHRASLRWTNRALVALALQPEPPESPSADSTTHH